MLKKAGIVVAVAAAGVLAVAPLAFAGEKGGDWDKGSDHGHGHSTSSSYSPTCSFGNASDSGNEQAALGASSLLGVLGTAANAAAPVTAQTNAPIGSCNNISDVVDLNSNNDTKTVDNSKEIDNSKDITKNESSTSSSSITSTLGGLIP